jgi:hypothetical protein
MKNMLALETSATELIQPTIPQPVFLVDIDQTIIAGVEVFLRRYPLNAEYKDVYSYNLDKCLGHGMHNAYMNFLNTHKNIPAYPGAIAALHEMITVGELLIVTARPPKQIARFSEDHPGFTVVSKSDPDIPMAELYIDDNPDPEISQHATFVALVDQPWNRDITQYPRFPSLVVAWNEWRKYCGL